MAIRSPRVVPSPRELEYWMTGTCQGDPAALEALFRATHPWLVTVARSYVGSVADAEDVVEEMFLKLWTRRDRIRVTGSVKAYLAVAVRNTAFNHRSRQQVETKYMQSPDAEPWVGGKAAVLAAVEEPSALISSDRMERVRQAIDALPARARETYSLYYQHGLTYAQIAEVMGVSVRTVEAQLVRCVRKLTQELRGALD